MGRKRRTGVGKRNKGQVVVKKERKEFVIKYRLPNSYNSLELTVYKSGDRKVNKTRV